MSFGFDEELPGGFQDADFEMRALEESANRAARARAVGICDHSWVQGPPGPLGHPTSVWTCHHCGSVFATEAQLEASIEEARGRM